MRRYGSKQPTLQDDEARLIAWLHGARPEKVLEATVQSLGRMYRMKPRELECRLLARQDQIRRQAADAR